MRRVRQLYQSGRTTTAPDDSQNIQTVQIKLDALRTRDGTPVLYHFGFSACLPVGTDVALVSVGGDTSNAVIVGSNHQTYRPKGLRPGESILYDAFGRKIHMTADGGIVVEANGTAITVNNATVVTVNATDSIQLNAPAINLN